MLEVVKKNMVDQSNHIHWIYQKYAAMLLGYLYGITQDKQKAERLLITILTAFITEQQQQNNKEPSWLNLRQYAQNKMIEPTSIDLDHRLDDCTTKQPDHLAHEYLHILNNDQRHIFCAVYYHGKSISYLATTLGQDENNIRYQLKSSLDKIRSARGN